MTRLLFIFFLSLIDLTVAFGKSNYSNLQSALEHKEEVKSLNLSYTFSGEAPDVFDQFPNLEILNLSSNRLTNLPPTLFRCAKLKILKLSRNKLSLLPAEISQLKNLEELSLSFNKL